MRFFIFIMIMALSHAQPFRILLDWYVNPHHVAFIVGIQKKMFGNLNVQLIPTSSSEEASKQVSVGNGEVMLSSEPRHMIRLLKGKTNLVPVGVLIDMPLEVLISRVPIQYIKTIGHASSGMGFSMMALESVMNLKDKKIIYLKDGLAQSFLNNHVDAIINIYKTYGLMDIQSHWPLNSKLYVFPFEQLGIPQYSEIMLFSHPKIANNKQIHNFLLGLNRAIEWCKNNVEEAVAIMVDAYPELNSQKDKEITKKVISLLSDDTCAIKNNKNLENFIKKKITSGGSDGTRTRDLRRDRPTL
jgi:putative hydroxymethylpyrimidine transport system substrate-binding protein